jgi:glycosyltransferase involved in cell wall biosynthesis
VLIGGAQEGIEDYAEALEQQIARLDLARSIDRPGWVDRPDLAWSGAWVYAQPSHTESYCIAVVEAMASHLPVVGSDVPGICEHLADAVGQLVPAGDAPALADALVALLDDPQRRAEMGERGRARVETYGTVDDHAAAWARRYDRLAR